MTQRPKIAIEPHPDADLAHYVEAGGGLPAPLDADTVGLVWTIPTDADRLKVLLDEHPGIRWVQLPFAGVDAFVPIFRDGITWTSAKGAYSEPVAEFALALTLGALRELPRRARATSWGDKVGTMLYGLNVLVVGAGGISQEFIRLIEPFRTHVTVVRRTPGDVRGAERTVTTDRLAEVLPDADVVVLAAASTGTTRHLIDAAALRSMKSTAVLVNIARGPLVDTEALVAALRDGEIAGAAVDVTDPEPLPDGHPLWSLPNALVTPHSADTPEMCAPLLGARVEANVRALVSGGAYVGVVDIVAGY